MRNWERQERHGGQAYVKPSVEDDKGDSQLPSDTRRSGRSALGASSPREAKSATCVHGPPGRGVTKDSDKEGKPKPHGLRISLASFPLVKEQREGPDFQGRHFRSDRSRDRPQGVTGTVQGAPCTACLTTLSIEAQPRRLATTPLMSGLTFFLEST